MYPIMCKCYIISNTTISPSKRHLIFLLAISNRDQSLHAAAEAACSRCPPGANGPENHLLLQRPCCGRTPQAQHHSPAMAGSTSCSAGRRGKGSRPCIWACPGTQRSQKTLGRRWTARCGVAVWRSSLSGSRCWWWRWMNRSAMLPQMSALKCQC